MTGPSLRIVFNVPRDHTLYYYKQMLDGVDHGRITNKPEVTPDIRLAHKFNNGEAAVAHRDLFRKMYTSKEGYKISIQDQQGNVAYEREETPPEETGDRLDEWIIPQGWEATGLGFRVKPALTASLGRCWGLRSCDVPSLAGRDIETIYSKTPEECVARAMVLWYPDAQPFEHPHAELLDTIAATKTWNQYLELRDGPKRRLRPGDLGH